MSSPGGTGQQQARKGELRRPEQSGIAGEAQTSAGVCVSKKAKQRAGSAMQNRLSPRASLGKMQLEEGEAVF